MTNSIVLRSYVSRRLAAAGRALIPYGRVRSQHASHATSWRDDDQGPRAVCRDLRPRVHRPVPRPALQRAATRRAAALRRPGASDATAGGGLAAIERDPLDDLRLDESGDAERRGGDPRFALPQCGRSDSVRRRTHRRLRAEHGAAGRFQFPPRLRSVSTPALVSADRDDDWDRLKYG